MQILIVEDNVPQLELLTRLLEREGYAVDGCTDGATGLCALTANDYALAILDRMLPEMDGLSVLRRYRAQGGAAPVILLTALSAVGDRVDGLNAGADDYLVKPFAPEELLARVRALLRRPAALQSDSLTLGDVVLLRREGRLEGPEGGCTLSKREAALLHLFLSNPGQVLSRETILLRVWGSDSDVEERNVDNFILLIRRRLNNVGSGVRICTVRGFGYRMEAENA